jgi:pyruvate dehydrogenase E2 component (dihydrolipoamide acetyltransferase)
MTTTTAPTGARPRRGRPRHGDSPRARAHARRTPASAADATVAATQLTSVVEVDLTGVAADDLLVTVASAAVRAAVAHPAVVHSRGVHLGVDARDGTTAVVIEDAHELTAAALATRMAAGQSAAVRPTLEVVDTGSRGILLDTPAVGSDRTAVLGIGAVVRRPVVRATDGGEAIVVRAVAHLSLSHDAQLLGSDVAADFLRAVKDVLEEAGA